MEVSSINSGLRDAHPKLLPGTHVEVRSLEEGFEGSWHAATVLSFRGGVREVRYDHLLVDDGSEILVELIRVTPVLDGVEDNGVRVCQNYRGLMRPVPPDDFRVEDSGILHYGLCVDAFVSDAWWEGVVFDHQDGLDQRLVFFPDLGDEQVVKIENLRVTHDWCECTGRWTTRGDWLLLELIQEHEKELFVGVSVRQLWYDMRAKEAFRIGIKEWTCWIRSMWEDLVVEVIRDNLDLTAECLLSVIESQNGVNFVYSQSKSDATLRREGPLHNRVEKTQLPVASPGSVRRKRGRSATKSDRSSTKSDSTWHVEGNLRDHVEEDHVASTSSGPSQRTRNRLRNKSAATVHSDSVLQEHSEENQLALTWQGPSKTRNSSLDCALSCEDVLQDQVEEKQLALVSSEEANLKRKEDSSNLSNRPKKMKGSYEIKLGGQEGRSDAVLAIQESEEILPIKTIKGNVHLSDDHLEDGNSDPPAFTSRGVNVDPISVSVHSDVSSVTNIRECRTDDMSKLQDGRFVQDPIDKFLHISRVKGRPDKRIKDELRMHLSGLGWKIKYLTYRQPVYHYTSPEGRTFNSLIKLCNALRPSKDNNNITAQNCFSEGHSTTAPREQGNKRSLGKTKKTFKTKEPVEVEPEFCPGALVELCGLEPRPRQKNLPALRLKAKKHLAAMGWKFWYVGKYDGRELRYASPYNKVYNSLRTACQGCLEEGPSTSTMTMQGEKSIEQAMHGNLSSAIVCTESDEFSHSRELEFGNMKVKRVKGPRKRKRDNSLPFTSRLKASCSDTRQHSMSAAILCSKAQGDPLDQNPTSQEQKKRKKVRALTRKGDHLDGSSPSRLPRSNKRARQVVPSNPANFFPRTVLSWLVDNNVILPREKVYYMKKNQSRPLLEGKITRDGIKCSCCQKVYGLSKFEAHAGSTYHRPAEHIFLEDGRSLLDCQKQMVLDGKSTDYISSQQSHKTKSNLQNNKNDCICSVCHYGGILVLCDHCPSSFHLGCIGLEEVPGGKWFCPSCRCGLCGQGEFNGNIKQFTDETILYCDQCEREYHVGCVRKQRGTKLDSCPKESWFCSDKCEKIFLSLHTLLGKSVPVGVDNFSWSILKFTKDGYESDACKALTMAELHSKLNVALSVMHECFEPIKEPQTKDLVKDVLFNRRSNLKRLDFRGFYTILLEKEDELISVATIRVYGGKVAEVPLIGTRVQYRRKGMCRMLMNLLEKKLAELGVERLLLPAIPQVLHAWTTSFGFTKMTTSERLEFVEYTFLDFQDTTMCQKKLKSGPTKNVVAVEPKDQYGVQNELNLSNTDAAFDGRIVDSKVIYQDEHSDIMKQLSLGVPACNDCSTTEMDFPLTTTDQTLWRKYENYSPEVDEKQKEDEECEQTEYFRYYRRKKGNSPTKLCDTIPIPITI